MRALVFPRSARCTKLNPPGLRCGVQAAAAGFGLGRRVAGAGDSSISFREVVELFAQRNGMAFLPHPRCGAMGSRGRGGRRFSVGDLGASRLVASFSAWEAGGLAGGGARGLAGSLAVRHSLRSLPCVNAGVCSLIIFALFYASVAVSAMS